MKKILLIALALAGFSAPLFAQVPTTTLELLNPLTGTSTVVITPGSSFSLNIEVAGLPTTPALDSFDVTLSGSTTATTALPTGITFTGFSNLVSGFEGGSDGVNHPTSYSAAGVSMTGANDISFSATPVSLLTANFTTTGTLAPGTYSIDFPPTGGFQNLFNFAGQTISYAPIDATILVNAVVAPEPKTTGILLMGLAMIIGLHFLKRTPSDKFFR